MQTWKDDAVEVDVTDACFTTVGESDRLTGCTRLRVEHKLATFTHMCVGAWPKNWIVKVDDISDLDIESMQRELVMLSKEEMALRYEQLGESQYTQDPRAESFDIETEEARIEEREIAGAAHYMAFGAPSLRNGGPNVRPVLIYRAGSAEPYAIITTAQQERGDATPLRLDVEHFSSDLEAITARIAGDMMERTRPWQTSKPAEELVDALAAVNRSRVSRNRREHNMANGNAEDLARHKASVERIRAERRMDALGNLVADALQ